MNDIYVGFLVSETSLSHHGIKGMHWGVRRFQKKDGSLTSAGKTRYGVKGSKKSKSEPETKRKGLSKGQKAAIAAAAAVGVGLAAYGAYKLHDSRTPKLVNTGESKTKELFGATFKPSTFEYTKFNPATFEPTKIDIPIVNVSRTDVPRTSIPRTEVERTDIPRTNVFGDDRLINAVRSSDPDRARRAKKTQDILSSAVDNVTKDFRSGKIDQREYANRLNTINKEKQNYGKPSKTFKNMTIDDLKKMDLW